MVNESGGVHWHEQSVLRKDREALNGHRGGVVWFTGLSGSGKSTIANLVDHKLHAMQVHTFLLDGDNVRHGLNATTSRLSDQYNQAFGERFGLGFSEEDRQENIRRIGEVAALFAEAGLLVLTAFVSPYRRDRDAVRNRLEEGDFVEVFVDAPLEICEQRDPKGLYRKARAGEIQGMTGIDDPYESPERPELVLPSGQDSAESLADEVLRYLRAAEKIPSISRWLLATAG
ncbi:MAG: adenylyl-sulfate kinase [Planctomycetota bacterium]|nr:adenylyl-sulfate kinase [Planctomycetota bacterium]